MNEKQLGLVLIVPMILGTAALLVRHRALGIKGAVLVTVATVAVAAFLFGTL